MLMISAPAIASLLLLVELTAAPWAPLVQRVRLLPVASPLRRLSTTIELLLLLGLFIGWREHKMLLLMMRQMLLLLLLLGMRRRRR